jgi:sugar transferase (PEP-CTERM/EpsH1 system associated)
MARILSLCHRAPFPPNKGEKIRAFHILKHLSGKHDVWLGAIADEILSPSWQEWIGKNCRGACIAKRGSLTNAVRLARALIAREPLSIRMFRDGRLLRWTRELTESKQIDVVYVFSSAMAQYVLERSCGRARLIADFVDVDSEKFRQYAAMRAGPSRWLFSMEAHRLMRFDKLAASRAEAVIFVTDSERQIFARYAPDLADRAYVMPNGIDTDYFRPQPPHDISRAPTILFVGTMDYLPNVDGALWFARSIFPQIRLKVSDACFRIVGAKPAHEIRALTRLAGIDVTGAVPDVRPYYHDADVVVAPLRIGRGIQNKVLEGMAMAKPVVTTPEALSGIEAEHGRHVLIARSAQEISDAVMDVLLGRAPTGLGANARERVIEQHKWASHLARLDRLIEGGDPL